MEPINSSQGAETLNSAFKDTLYIRKLDNCITHPSVYDIMKIYGTIKRITFHGITNDQENNSVYIQYENEAYANEAYNKCKNLKIQNQYLNCSLFNSKNIKTNDDDFIPNDVESLTSPPQREKVNKVIPYYFLLIAEEGHMEEKIFCFLKNH